MKFDYSKIALPHRSVLFGASLLKPIIPIRVVAGERSLQYAALIDSGADFCIFHREIGESLGIDIESGEKLEFGGVQQADFAKAYIHNLTLVVGGLKCINSCWRRFSKAHCMKRTIFFILAIVLGSVFLFSGPSSPAISSEVCPGEPISSRGPISATAPNSGACTTYCSNHGRRTGKWNNEGWGTVGSDFQCCCLRGAGSGTARTRREVVVPCPTGLVCLGNPLDTSDIPTLIGGVLRMLFGLIGTIALIIFIYGGVLWMTAFGEEQKVKRGWDTMIWGTIGLVVIFGSYVAVDFILKAILGS